MATHERSWTLMRTHEYGVISAHAALSAHSPLEQCSFILMHAYEFCDTMTPWEWVLMATYECSWMVMNAQECSCSAMSTNKHGSMVPWSFMSTNECSSTVLSSYEPKWVLMVTHDHGARVPWALMSSQECSWHHGTILLCAPEWQELCMNALQRPWVLIAH